MGGRRSEFKSWFFYSSARDPETISHHLNDPMGPPQWFSNSAPQSPKGTLYEPKVDLPDHSLKTKALVFLMCSVCYQVSLEEDSVAKNV